MRIVHGLILMALTFAVMTAAAFGLQWLNARWSVLGTAPFAIAVIAMIIYLRRRDKAAKVEAQRLEQRRGRQSSDS